MANSRYISLLIAAFFGVASGVAEARPVHGGRSISAPVVPILTSSTVNFGATTRTGRGGVQLSQQDFTTTAVQPVHFYGTGLLSPSGPACTTWRQPVFVSNSSGRTGSDFTLIANNTPEGATAITPVPTSTGQGNLAGDYVWNIQCDGAGGASNVAQLTYHTVANQVNIGTADRTDFGVYPTNFGNIAGAKIVFSTGYVHTDRQLIGFAGTSTINAVTLTNADVAKPARLTNLNATNANLMNIDDLVISGDLTAFTSSPTCLMCVTGTLGTISNVNFHRDFGYFSEALLGGTSRGFFRADGCVGTCGMYDSGVDYVSNCVNQGTGSAATFQNSWCRHIYENFFTLGNSGDTSGNGWTLNDVFLIAPMTNNAFIHPDHGQIGDGGTVLNETVNGLFQATSGGDTFAQGFPFNGTAIGGVTNYTGYVDDGTAGHGPGKVATFLTGATGASFPGARIYASSGSPMAVSDMVMMTSCVGTCGTATKVNLNLASNVNIGSPGTPVTFYGITNVGWSINSLVYAGGSFHGVDYAGEQGTNLIKNFGLVAQFPNPFYETSFTGSVSGTTLTISSTPTNNIAGVVSPQVGGRLKYTGCDYCGVGIDHQLTGPSNGPGTYLLTSNLGTIASQPMSTSTTSPAATGAPRFDIAACDRPPLHGGTFTIQSGYAQSGFNQINGTCANLVFANTPTTVAADFALGALPATTLAAFTTTFWETKTPAQILAEVCKAMLPAAGHQLDAGGGNWYGPFTGTGEWNDGRGKAITGCGIH